MQCYDNLMGLNIVTYDGVGSHLSQCCDTIQAQGDIMGIMGDCVGGGCDTAQRLGCLAEKRNPQKLQRGLKGFKIYVSRNENVSFTRSTQY